jgi:muramoyltetrapeptide carboxypeptidase
VIRPQRLRPGDRVALVAPASPLAHDDLNAGVAELRALGFDAVYDERVLLRDGYVAGAAAVRADVMHAAWRDPSIRALIATRGGYGSAQVLPDLDPAIARGAGKPFIGYSDTTALLSWHLQAGLVSFHGPMVERRLARGAEGYHRDSFLAALCETTPMGALAPDTLEVFQPGDARGVLAGGTLTQLAASLGTPWAFDPPGPCVLFLEDIGERPYRIDRMFTQLAQAGILARASAIVFGMFPGCDEPGGMLAIRDTLRALTAGFPGPVLFGFPSGHTPGPTWTLPFGVAADVITEPRPALIITEAAVL